MEIRGEEFIKKVQLRQEKNEIEQRLNEINQAEAIYEEPVDNRQAQQAARLDREIEIQEEQEYSDIMLGKTASSNEVNKKKYLILGLILVILFLLTIIIIRLLTNDSVENDSFSKNSEATTQKVLENDSIEEQYQKIINEKLKNIKEEKAKEALIEEKIDEKLNLEQIEKEEKVIKTQEVKPDVFEIKKEEPKEVVQPPVVKKVEPPKQEVKIEPKKTPKKVYQPKEESTITTKPSGTFVQIGAFSKMPNKNYLDNITRQGFKYSIYKVSINGKMFHKVLIGPYNSRGQARLATDDIKKKLNISGAFILKF